MEALLLSFGTLAVAELGDKTQLLCLLLAARLRKPWPVIAGVAIATLGVNILAGVVGVWLAKFLKPEMLNIVLGISMLLAGGAMLLPEKEEKEEISSVNNRGVFWISMITFFIAEMGDRTQLATAVLAAKYQHLGVVVLGASLGMMAVNAPAVLIGHRLGDKIPMQWIKRVSAGIFAALGIALLTGF